MSSPIELLKQYWGHDIFRPIQEEIITSVMAGNDTLALLPTGGGKSICFQIPALLSEGICLVISPLIALMKDQVEQLKKRGIPALAVHSGMTYFEVKQTLQNAAFGSFKFLYVSPERLETALFKDYLPSLKINLLAVDEAHCISQWGYDFRPPYLRIAQLRKELPGVPVLALTASATPVVQEDICSKLAFVNAQVFRQPFDRPNLSYSVFKMDSKINKLLEILRKVPGSAIVYCRNRKRCKQLAKLLSLNHLSADFYHAGLTQNERNRKQEDWINNKIRVIVCTNAFGMGIDKPDVRVVIHMDIPDNLESYYQEAGRAGRDRLRSFAVLLYEQKEMAELGHLPEIKYPPVADIRKMYQSLANFLQVAVGAGEGLYFDFNIHDFVKQFQLDLLPVIHSLKALEQDGHLTFNEQVFLPTRIGFTCDRETLENFEKSHPKFDGVIKFLLRTYEGIFDNIVSVNESLISRLNNMTPADLQLHLNELRAFGLIEYQPQKETPQVFFNQNRAPAAYLTFNNVLYADRKEQYRLRVEAIASYVNLKDDCRSRYIGLYFGDTSLKACGSCDNCLQQKNLHLSKEDFMMIESKIISNIPIEGIDIQTLLQKLDGIKKEKAWKVLDYLQAERQIFTGSSGIIMKADDNAAKKSL